MPLADNVMSLLIDEWGCAFDSLWILGSHARSRRLELYWIEVLLQNTKLRGSKHIQYVSSCHC